MDFDLGPRLILDRDRRTAIWALVSRPLGHHLLDPHGCHFLVVRHRFGVWQDGDTRIDGHVACPCYRLELCQVMVGAVRAVGLHAFRQIIFGRRVGIDPWVIFGFVVEQEEREETRDSAIRRENLQIFLIVSWPNTIYL